MNIPIVESARTSSTWDFSVGLGRASAGALIFSLPMLMTMEMWWLGFHADPFRLAILLTVLVPLLVGLSRIGGIRRTRHWVDDVADALVAIAVACVAALVFLSIFGLITDEMSAREIIGKIAVQILPGSIGAMLAQNQLGGGDDTEKQRAEQSYWGELFLMTAGALFLSLNVAPTEEIVLIAHTMSVWQDVGLALISILLMHFIVYAAGFSGTEKMHPRQSFLSVFARFTVVGYALVYLVSLFLLWTFGRTDGLGLEQILSVTVVLSFPGALGASAARLIL